MITFKLSHAFTSSDINLDFKKYKRILGNIEKITPKEDELESVGTSMMILFKFNSVKKGEQYGIGYTVRLARIN